MRQLFRSVNSLWRNLGGCLKRSVLTDIKIEENSKINLYVDNSAVHKFRIFISQLRSIMEATSSSLHPSLTPPDCVQGMTDLHREKFVKKVNLPGLKLPKKEIHAKGKLLKALLLRLRKFNAIAELAENDPLRSSHRLVLFDPGKMEDKAFMEKIKELLKDFEIDALEKYELEFQYENWSYADIFKAVLPEESEGLSAFTQIGHIAHLNLKPENLPYKKLIGQVLIDKIGSVKTVVNKLNTIDNTYRNFEMELLAGEENYVTQAKENYCTFEFDFSKVYWNSRLSTEHQRIVNSVQEGSDVYDVFAGVGPFAIPLAKKKCCQVFANDLNPHSYKALERNLVLNKIDSDLIHTYNMDGRKFITSIMKADLLQKIQGALSKEDKKSDEKLTKESDETFYGRVDIKSTKPFSERAKSYVVMNLPALAIDFLDAFDSLLADLPNNLKNQELIEDLLPAVHCYAFCPKDVDIEETIIQRAEEVIKQPLPSDASVRIVRDVSPNKEMVCLSFKLWPEFILGSKVTVQRKEQENFDDTGQNELSDEPAEKKQKTSIS